MRTIYKYHIEIRNFQILKVPQDRKILSVQVQKDEVCIWAEVDTQSPMSDLKVYVFGTGHPIQQKDLNYIGSVQLLGGDLVFHVFWER